jgi:glycosyltransferase involved in cell wall biosynthesis
VGEPAAATVSITVVIPTIAGREAMLARALASVQAQTMPCQVIVELDSDRRGAAAARNRALAKVDSEWVAFCDDDDEWYPNHLRLCARHARLTGADVVYPGYDIDGDDPIGCFGIPFDPFLLHRRNYIPVTTLCRTELVRKVGGFSDRPDENGDPCEDWGLWLALLDAGATFSHLPQRTWLWHNNANGTRGRGTGD